jgi:hypothetical protein
MVDLSEGGQNLPTKDPKIDGRMPGFFAIYSSEQK